MTTIITPRTHNLGGGFEVRRAVPSLQARSVGPFVFVDHMGPAVFEPGRGIDVRPHPHIGLATVTFLWDGAINHKDTLGSEQVILPGDVNWMTSGRGIAHSERTPADERGRPHTVHGMQTWVALPKTDEETAPEFHHHPARTLPQWQRDGASRPTRGRSPWPGRYAGAGAHRYRGQARTRRDPYGRRRRTAQRYAPGDWGRHGVLRSRRQGRGYAG